MSHGRAGINREANMKTVYLNASYFPAVELLSAGNGGS